MTLFQDKSNPLLAHLVRAAVRLGLGRWRLKHLFAKVWQMAVGTGPIDVVYHGIKLRLFPVGNTIESKILFSSRRREGKELDALAAVLSGGGVFFDIGANIGYYSMMAAKFGAGAVCAVEANPDLAEKVAAPCRGQRIWCHCPGRALCIGRRIWHGVALSWVERPWQ
jgi:hypothetical protein